ncbi:outer membrane beta-barrel protein [Flavobacterium seoulense]|uniref:Outer membrane protein beta-barrel domain-containing protein n=1 Tax=Flavobacterium seoulense TaxID=1492738 RepID=A0A066WU35_9FLAO|nr:outer membrane beta-barrel protein [Flavobacterium seoulense]KDN56093.1 hypothetical protein FEM21_06450 [Flavobacterium seoulense]
MKKDDIEKLFSSLEDFSKMPPDNLWKGIEEKLNFPESKKRTAYYWWPLAACLVIGLGLLGTFYFHSNSENHLINAPIQQENGVVNQSRSIDAAKPENNVDKTQNDKVNNRVSNSSLSNKEKEETQTLTKTTISNLNKNQIATISNSNLNKGIIAGTVKQDNSLMVNKTEDNQQTLNRKEENFVPQNKVATIDKSEKEKTVTESKVKENSPIVDSEENALAALVKEQSKKEKIAEVEDKWSLQVFAGVNSSQNLKNQKSLGNTIESQKGHSYGVKTNYKLNKRWAVSTGLKVSQLGQQVANVSYVNSAKSLVNVAIQPLSSPQMKGGISNNANYQFVPNMDNSSAKSAMSSSLYEKGNLSQTVQYLEMPMEVSYSVFNKGKARINMNTGGFVGKVISNQVLLNDSSIGENQDVNDVVFGTVLSSTLQYELFKKTKVFVEPGMNYYTQPVQNQNFNQFQLIFNFGLNVSF